MFIFIKTMFREKFFKYIQSMSKYCIIFLKDITDEEVYETGVEGLIMEVF